MNITAARIAVAGALTALVAGVLPLTVAVGADAPLPAAVTMIGSAGRFPGHSAMVIVEAQLAVGRNTNPAHVASKLLDIPVASERITGSAFRVPVPMSPVLRHAERLGNGNVNFIVIIDSGTSSTFQGIPVPLTAAAAPGNTSAEAILRSHTVHVPRFPPYQLMNPRLRRAIAAAGGLAALAVKPGGRVDVCVAVRYGKEAEDTTRIGEVHVAYPKGMSDLYEYINQADSTITIGSSASPTGPWNASGSLTITNSMGTDGSFPAGRKTDEYANAHIYYQRYKLGPNKFCPTPSYNVQADHAAGDSFPDRSGAPGNPYKGCKDRDPNGYVTVSPHGGRFNSDTSHAAGYNGIATVWGFSFGGSTGFTTDIRDNYTNNSSIRTYVCGTFVMPYPPILYNNS